MTITYTKAAWDAFKSGTEAMKDLKARGMKNPRLATQTRHEDGSVTFTERD